MNADSNDDKGNGDSGVAFDFGAVVGEFMVFSEPFADDD